MYFTFITKRSKQQGASALLTMITGLYIRRESTTYIYTMSVPRTENWRLVRASASSMLREGDWSHMEYMTVAVKLRKAGTPLKTITVNLHMP